MNNNKIKVVVVEDDKALNKLICKRLEKNEYATYAFSTARSALEWLAVNKADLIITDLALPDYSGEEFIKVLHKNNITTPFIVATGRGSERMAVKMLKKGAKDYLIKNTDFLDNLPSTVQKIWREIQLESLLEKARDHLKGRNVTLSSVNNLSPDGILVIDPYDKIISANSLVYNMWGLKKGNKTIKNGSNFFKQASRQLVEPQKLSEINLKISHSAHGLILSDILLKNGKTYELYSAPLNDESDDDFVGRAWYVHDITLHKQAQQALEESKKEIEKNANIRSQFFAIVSHDVKTPLNSIMGFTDMLKNTNLDDEQKEFLSQISSSSEHLLALVKDIIDFAKMESDDMPFHIQPVAPTEIFETVGHSFLPLVKNKNIKLEFKKEGVLPEVISSDLLRFKQVLMNLVSNAIKFTKDGGQITVTSFTEGEYLIIKVTDTGIGIAKESIKDIFNPFTQADTSIAQLYGGSGLGLAIAKKIALRLKGDLVCESEVDVGSSFIWSMKIEIPEGF